MNTRIRHLKRWRLSLRKNLKVIGNNLDITRRYFIISHALGPQVHLATDRHDKFIAHLLRRFHCLLRVVKHHLYDALTVPQIDKYQASVIATSFHPTHNDDFFSLLRGSQLTTVMCSLFFANKLQFSTPETPLIRLTLAKTNCFLPRFLFSYQDFAAERIERSA